MSVRLWHLKGVLLFFGLLFLLYGTLAGVQEVARQHFPLTAALEEGPPAVPVFAREGEETHGEGFTGEFRRWAARLHLFWVTGE